MRGVLKHIPVNGLQTWADYQLTDKEGDDYVDPPREVNGLRCIDAPN